MPPLLVPTPLSLDVYVSLLLVLDSCSYLELASLLFEATGVCEGRRWWVLDGADFERFRCFFDPSYLWSAIGCSHHIPRPEHFIYNKVNLAQKLVHRAAVSSVNDTQPELTN